MAAVVDFKMIARHRESGPSSSLSGGKTSRSAWFAKRLFLMPLGDSIWFDEIVQKRWYPSALRSIEHDKGRWISRLFGQIRRKA